MSLVWNFGSFDGAPLVWLGGSALVLENGIWSTPDPSWIMEARMLAPAVFFARFGEIDLPPIPEALKAALRSSGEGDVSG